jgi:A118 family predicted phage portal protein
MENEYAIPACVRQAITDAGYSIDTTMDSNINDWWAWFTAESKFYDGFERVDKRLVHVHRRSLHPARRVCREMVSLILDDDGTTVTVEQPDSAEDDGTPEDMADDPTAHADDDPTEEANEFLHAWMDATKFMTTAQRATERGYALGTAALALWFDVTDEGTVIKARRYDARMIVPLSWDDDGVRECAFCTQATVKGKKVDQLQMHVFDLATGTYHVITKMFREGAEWNPDGYLPDFDTKTPLPTFCIIRPNLDNVYADMSPYGQSLFADAIDAIKTVDECFDSFSRELRDTKIKTFMSDELFETETDAAGKRKSVPMSPDASVIRKVVGNGQGITDMIQTFAPPIRVDAIKVALDMAVAELGDQTGFGCQYFRVDAQGGIKTAFEVSSDNAALGRNIVKHENVLRPALEGILKAVLETQRIHNGLPIPEGCNVSVDFDDSIIQDTQSEKNMALAEMAAMPEVTELKVAYLTRFKGFTEEEAEEAIGEASEPAAEDVMEAPGPEDDGEVA